MSIKSDTWYHFVKKGLSGVCQYCHSEVKTYGNTTNLRNHLKRRHPCIKSVSQQKLVLANNSIGVSDDKKETVVCTLSFSLQYNICLFYLHACLYYIFLYFLSFYFIIWNNNRIHKHNPFKTNDDIATTSTSKGKFGKKGVLSLTNSKEYYDSDLESIASSSVSLKESKLNQLTMYSYVNNIKAFNGEIFCYRRNELLTLLIMIIVYL